METCLTKDVDLEGVATRIRTPARPQGYARPPPPVSAPEEEEDEDDDEPVEEEDEEEDEDDNEEDDEDQSVAPSPAARVPYQAPARSPLWRHSRILCPARPRGEEPEGRGCI